MEKPTPDPESPEHVCKFEWTNERAGPGCVIQRCKCGEEYEKDVS